jgi:hypothetical protein
MSFGETVVAPTGRINSASRLVGLLDRSEGRIRRRYLRLVRESQQLATLEEIAALLEAGQVEAAMALFDDLGPSLASSLEQVYATAGLSAAEVLRSQVDTLFDFNLANPRAVRSLQETRLRLVREFRFEQRLASQVLLEEAFAAGLAPIEQARILKRSIGLTQHQARIIQNYRRQLERRSSGALTRALRDKRFDSTIARAIELDRPLTSAQIDRMVGRYQERWIQYRAQTIAKTETLAAAGAADLELWEQAVEEGVIAESDVFNTWRTSGRANRRDSHRAMEGQKRLLGIPFDSGDGNKLRFPGDPRAPASDRINCNCVVARQLRRGARGLAGGPFSPGGGLRAAA